MPNFECIFLKSVFTKKKREFFHKQSLIFYYRLRSLSTGLAAASCFVQSFAFSKTFYYLNSLIHLPGCFLLYGMGGIIGFVYLYFKLPETEGKTLAEIEEYYSVSTKKQKVDII